MDSLPSALDRIDAVVERIGGRTPALFLDYDGTLSPIVREPGAAELPEATGHVLRSAARRMPVAVVSGRDLEDVRARVGVGDVWYAGSHGLDLAGPEGQRREEARSALPALDEAEGELRRRLEGDDGPPGARVERKRFAIAVHYREVPASRVPEVRTAAREVAGLRPGLRTSGGKKIVELRPDVDWDKGRAVVWLWGRLDLRPATHHPLYVGDDVTDEDAFRVLAGELDGTGIAVRGEADPRETRARFSLRGPDEVRRFVEALTSSLDGR